MVSARIKAVLFDLGDTLWHSFALCGMNPAASTKAEGFNPQRCSYFLDDHETSATFENRTFRS
jgi:FMN phosphatase YigB (HAD superfamily)